MKLPKDRYVARLVVADPDEIQFEMGDITAEATEAIVNAANAELAPGAGVCGAIHRAGGESIFDECAAIRAKRGRVKTGEVVATGGGALQAKHVIHAVGPVWSGGDAGEPEQLASCYREAMRLADELKLHSITFPAISTGIYGYPVEQAAWVAIPTLIEAVKRSKSVSLVRMVLFDRATLDVFTRVAMAQRRPGAGDPYDVLVATWHAGWPPQ